MHVYIDIYNPGGLSYNQLVDSHLLTQLAGVKLHHWMGWEPEGCNRRRGREEKGIKPPMVYQDLFNCVCKKTKQIALTKLT